MAAGREPARWALVSQVAWRFLRGHRSRLLDGTARSALFATMLGVAAMIIAMALMTGYRRDLQRKLIRGNAAIMAYPLSAEAVVLDPATAARLARVEGLEGSRRVAYGQGSLASERVPEGLDVTVRGEEPGGGLRGLGRLDPGAEVAPAEAGVAGVVVGRELARALGAAEGATLRLMVLGMAGGRPRFRFHSVRVTGTFASGFSEFDRRMVVMDRDLLERLSGHPVGASLYEFEVRDPERSAEVAERLRRALGPDFLVRDWRQLNEELFTALELQQVALFFVLGLIVLVSTFSVASSLVVLVRERMRDIGLLAALGLGPRHLQVLFLLFGAALSLFGTAGGVALGAGVSWLLTRFELIRFGPEVAEVYFLSSVPFRVRGVDVAAVVLFTLLVTLLACWLPTRRAARVRPARALRYE